MAKDYYNGPIDNNRRKCTDLFCCILLAILILAMFVLAIYCWSTNGFSKLTTPYDAEGKGCGTDYPEYPYIYFVSPNANTLWRTVCVSSCPEGNEKALSCQPNKYVTTCNKVDNPDNEVTISIYPTTILRDSICVPTSVSLYNNLQSAIGQSSLWAKFLSLGQVWPVLLLCIPIAIILSIIFMIFIRFTAACFVYLLLGLSIAACLALGIYLLVVPSSTYAGVSFNRAFVVIIAVLLIIFGVIMTIGFLCYRKKIRLASVIVQTSARFVKENCIISFLPFVLFLIMTVFLTVWILQVLGYYSMGTPVKEEKQLPFQHFQTTNFVKTAIVIHIFHLFWVICFLVETGDFLVSGAATSWYYTRANPFGESVTRYSRFHIGSVAMGSFFMALFGFLRFLYELLVPEKTEQEGCMANWKKFCDCCCCLCIKYIFNWFNSGAYTYIHLSGQGYCNSAWQAFALRFREPVCTAVVAFMSALFSVIIRVGITVLTVLMCYIILKNAEPYKSQVTDATFPNIFFALIGFAISSFFVSLYSEAMESIYICYLANREFGGRQDQAPQELRDFLFQAKSGGGNILIE